MNRTKECGKQEGALKHKVSKTPYSHTLHKD